MPAGQYASNARHRWSVASRVLAAIVGGYAVTSLLNFAVPLLLPLFGLSQAQGLMAMTMMSFLVYAAIVMAVFHARSAAWAWLWLAVSAIPLGIIVAILLPDALP